MTEQEKKLEQEKIEAQKKADVARAGQTTTQTTSRPGSTFAHNPRQTEQLTREEAEKQSAAGPRQEGMRHEVRVDRAKDAPVALSAGLGYDLSDLLANLRDGNVFTAVKRAVALLNTLLNGSVSATAARQSRPATMRPPGRTLVPMAPGQVSEIENYIAQLQEWSDRAENRTDMANVQSTERSHAVAASITGEDIQILISLILRLINRNRS